MSLFAACNEALSVSDFEYVPIVGAPPMEGSSIRKSRASGSANPARWWGRQEENPRAQRRQRRALPAKVRLHRRLDG